MVSFGVQGQVGSTVSLKEFVVGVSGPRKSSKPQAVQVGALGQFVTNHLHTDLKDPCKNQVQGFKSKF